MVKSKIGNNAMDSGNGNESVEVELRIPPLPVFDNPAYESSDADLESMNNTINSTKSFRSGCISSNSSRSSNINKNNSNSTGTGYSEDENENEENSESYPNNKKGRRSSNCSNKAVQVPLDPVQDLRNLAREISPGVTVTLTKSLESQLQRLNSRSDITRFPVILSAEVLSRRQSIDKSPSKKHKEKMSDSEIPNLGNGASNYSINSNFILANGNGNMKNGKIVMESEPSGAGGRKFYGFTRRQWCFLFILGCVNILSTMCVSLLSPFYPAEANRKGASDTENGMVFGVFELTVFIMSPILGKYMHKIGPKNVFNFGILITGTCSFCFGFLSFIDNRYAFIGLSLILRIIEAFGAAAHVTASFTLIALEFNENVFTIFAAMETCSGVGLMIGPLVGSLLYKIGKFVLPFTAIGGLLFIGALLSFLSMPMTSGKKSIDEKENVESSEKGIMNVLKIPSVALAAFSVAATAIGIGFNMPLLEPHIRRFELDDVTKGFIFIINGGTYALTSPLWGRVCDKTSQPKILTLLGASLILLGFVLIGPAPFLPFDTILWVTCIGLFIQGLGIGAAFVSGFTQGLRGAIENGFPEGVSTYGLISGLWFSMFALGNFIGPFVSGILEDLIGYRRGSLFVIVVQLLVIGITLVFIISDRKSANTHVNKNSELVIHDGNGIAVKEAKFFTSEFKNHGFDNDEQIKSNSLSPTRSAEKIV